MDDIVSVDERQNKTSKLLAKTFNYIAAGLFGLAASVYHHGSWVIRNIEDPETDTFEMVFFINAAGELS